MKLTIYKKMMLGFAAIIAIMIIASTYILLELNTVSDVAKVILTSNVQSVNLAEELQTILYDENQYAQKYLISRDKTYFSLFVETSRQFDQCLNSLHEVRSDEAERPIIKRMRQAHESFVASMQIEKDSEEASYNPVRDDIRSNRMKALYQSLDQLISVNQRSIENAMSRVKMTTSRSAKVALLLIAWTLLTAIAVAFIITRTITRPIADLIRGTEQIARGRFEPVSVSSNDEIASLADAVNDMADKIKKINELKAQMMEQIAHELQTPLQTMLSAYEFLKDQHLGPLNSEQHRMLDAICRGISQLENFSKQYLDLAKIESGIIEYHKELADILKIVEPLAEDAKLVAARKDITVELDVRSVPKVMVDVEKISVVVSNLLSNAIRYTRNGGKVRVKVAPCTLGAQLAVQDSGIGIDPKEFPNVFERFYQASNSNRIKRRGIGVGLALVKAFTEGHGGKVYAKSMVDRGSTFTVELPAAPDEFQDHALPAPAEDERFAHG